MMLPGQQPVGRSNLRAAAPPVEAKDGVVILNILSQRTPG
jgi:hypothetical protein